MCTCFVSAGGMTVSKEMYTQSISTSETLFNLYLCWIILHCNQGRLYIYIIFWIEWTRSNGKKKVTQHPNFFVIRVVFFLFPKKISQTEQSLAPLRVCCAYDCWLLLRPGCVDSVGYVVLSVRVFKKVIFWKLRLAAWNLYLPACLNASWCFILYLVLLACTANTFYWCYVKRPTSQLYVQPFRPHLTMS